MNQSNSKFQTYVIVAMFALLLAIAAAWLGWQHASNREKVALSTVDQGRVIVETQDCRDCHKVNDPFKAPTFEGLFGAEIDLADGRTVVADETYIRESIVNPGKAISYGYQNTMPSYKGKLKDDQIDLIVLYLKGIGRPPLPIQKPSEKPK